MSRRPSVSWAAWPDWRWADLTTVALNAAGNSAGTALFLLTSRLAIGAVLFALVLGVVSGLYPSWHAARLNPVAALRYE